MQDISKFIVDNWQWLVSVCAALFLLIIQIFKKRPKVSSVVDVCNFIIADDLPKFINEAERSGMIGVNKLAFVLKKCMALLSSYVILDETSEKEAESQFRGAVEAILSTPRKKG